MRDLDERSRGTLDQYRSGWCTYCATESVHKLIAYARMVGKMWLWECEACKHQTRSLTVYGGNVIVAGEG